MSTVSSEQKSEILKWFAMQDEITQSEILRDKHALVKAHAHEKNIGENYVLELHCLILTARQGWQAEQNCKKGRVISKEDAQQISVRRKRRASEQRSHRAKVREWLNIHFGKVVEYRRSGLSWRLVSLLIEKEHRLSISHTTVRKYYVNKL